VAREHACRPSTEYDTETLPETLELIVKFDSLHARQILDSRGYPTLEVRLDLPDRSSVSASTPSGASTGAHEVVELRDGSATDGKPGGQPFDPWQRPGGFEGRGVNLALAAATGAVADMLCSGRDWADQREVDDALSQLDGTPDLSRLGANTVIAVSMATARAFAAATGSTLAQWIADQTGQVPLMPVPHFNVVNGGAHAANGLAFQEFMIAPVGAPDTASALRCGAEVHHRLKKLLHQAGHDTGLGDEGGFAPRLPGAEEVLDLLVAAIEAAGYTADRGQVAIALDPAANSFHHGSSYHLSADKHVNSSGLIDLYEELLDRYPIRSIEDGCAEDDIDGWREMTTRLAGRIQIVGDDLLVTDPDRIRDAAREHLATAALIKPNQIGTVSRTLDALAAARDVGFTAMVSHRSGETLDTFVADLAVGAATGQIKAGAPARGERLAKYNRLTGLSADNPQWAYGLSTDASS